MGKILAKKTRVSKFKGSGVIKIQDKKLKPFIGKKVNLEVLE